MLLLRWKGPAAWLVASALAVSFSLGGCNGSDELKRTRTDGQVVEVGASEICIAPGPPGSDSQCFEAEDSLLPENLETGDLVSIGTEDGEVVSVELLSD